MHYPDAFVAPALHRHSPSWKIIRITFGDQTSDCDRVKLTCCQPELAEDVHAHGHADGCVDDGVVADDNVADVEEDEDGDGYD